MDGEEMTQSPVLQGASITSGGTESFLDLEFQNSTFSPDNGTLSTCFAGPGCTWEFYGHYPDLTQLASVYFIFIVIFVVITALGIAGNSMVIGVVWSNRSMRTPTNYYIVSLAVSDLLVITFAMPLKLVEYTADVDLSIFNTGLCSFAAFVMPAVVFTSIWTLVAISIDRYLVIIHPLKARSFNTRSRALRNIIIIWLAPFVILAPYFYPCPVLLYHFESEMGVIRRKICTDQLYEIDPRFSMIYKGFLFGMLFLLPVLLLSFTCGSIAKRLVSLTEDEKMLKNSMRKDDASRRKVAKMVLIVVLCFFICWCPYFVVSFLAQYTPILESKNYIFSLLLIHLFGFANSFMNPVIYAMMSQTFRSGFWLILTICCPQYRDLVAPSGRSGGRPSGTAVSQTDVVNERHPPKRGYNRFFRRESTQFSAVSDQDEERIGMTKIGKVSNNSNNNNRRATNNQTVQETERKQRAERLLHKFLDEEPPKKPNDVNTVGGSTSAVGKTPGSEECSTPLIGNDDQGQNCCVSNGPEVIYQSPTCKPSAEIKLCDDKTKDNLGQACVSTETEKELQEITSRDELIKFNASVLKCAAWKAANDASTQDSVILVINEDVPDARQSHHVNDKVPQIAIYNPSYAPGAEPLKDSEQGVSESTKATIGNATDEATTKV